jgi:hypothetical protein
MRDVYPVKYYKDEGFIERKIEIDEDDLERIIEEYLSRHADFEFDEIEIVNNRPMNIWLYAKCRAYIDPDAPEQEQIAMPRSRSRASTTATLQAVKEMDAGSYRPQANSAALAVSVDGGW